MKTLVRCTVAALALAVTIAVAPAQMEDKPGQPLLSPAAMASVKVGGKDIVIHYNTPSLRGRVMIGGEDPYDKVWRTGANPATSFVTAGDIMVGGLKVPAGSYTLYSLPEPVGTPWLLILNKQTGQWGTVYKPEMDLGRTPLHAGKLPASQEVMSLSFENTKANSTELHIKWALVDESVKIEAVK
jgi:hypothetical protein